MLLGREAEASRLATAWSDARTGNSSVLVLAGEAGIGKSALLAQARSSAADGLVLSTVGIEGESDVVYANLADIFRPTYDAIESIPPRQAAALASVFAIGPSSEADRFTVASGTLALLEHLAADRPVLITVDDAQWVDTESMEVLTFVANRLGSEGVVLLFGVRSAHLGDLRLGRFPTLTLAGLDGASARELIARMTPRPLAESSVARLVTEAGGNPLALMELPGMLSPEELALWSRGMEPLPIDTLLEEAFCGSVRYLPQTTQDALILLATLGSVPGPVLEAAMGLAGGGLEDLDPAEQAGLLVDQRGRPEFRHPLVRAAVYQTSTPSRRRRAHLQAAEVMERFSVPNALERRAWHLVSAGGADDEQLAELLERAAGVELGASNFGVAAKLYERSSQLTPPGGPAMRRMTQAADSTRLAGAIEEARDLLGRALELGDDPELEVVITYFRCRLDMWRGNMVAGRDELVRLAALVEPLDADGAVLMLTDAALASVEIGDLDSARACSERAMTLAAAESVARPPLATAAVRALVLGMGGDAGGLRALLDRRHDEVEAIDPLATDLTDQLSLVVSLAHLSVEEVERARVLLERAVAGARERSAVGVLPFRLGRLAWVDFWQGRWSAALATSHEALGLADDTGWAAERPNSLATLARVEAVTGRGTEARAHAELAITLAEETGTWSYAASARSALGLLELTLGDDAAAVEHLVQVAAFTAEAGMAHTPLMWWAGDLVEAYVHLGMLPEARAELARLTAAVAGNPVPTAQAVMHRCRALLEPDGFVAHLSAALSCHGQAAMPFERARTELLLGEQLRRRRQRAESRDPLNAALTTFERLGAPDWADRARAELEATGLKLSQPTEGLGALTPQELQVALAVARGASNREVAAQLFLSVKTVEFHLAHVFQKLGINRRSRLAALVARQDPASS